MTACVVLAGGAGRRLGGTDKAAVVVGGASMLDRVLAAARPVADPLVVVGPSRATSVAGVRFVVEDAPGGGPVPAVAAGLEAVAPADDDAIVLLAVDQPLLTTAAVNELLARLTADDRPSAVAAAGPDGAPNPLLAVYRAGALRAAVVAAGPDLAGARAASLLPAGTVTVELDAGATTNVNRPDDLARARAFVRREKSS